MGANKLFKKRGVKILSFAMWNSVPIEGGVGVGFKK